MLGAFFRRSFGLLYLALLFGSAATNSAMAHEVILEDHFERAESDDQKEEVGGGWTTNSRSRAKGNKQVDLIDGHLYARRHEVADHGVSIVHDLEFQDALITLRFKLGRNDELGINLADMSEKSVHAGHICQTKIRLERVRIQDMKFGAMKLEHRNANKAKTLTQQQKKLIETKKEDFPVKLKADQWHELRVIVDGDTMEVTIDGNVIGDFTSEGIGHPTKSRLRLAVAKEAWIDDVMVYRE